MNLIILRGRLGKDPQVFYTKDQKQITKFSIAVNSGWGDYKKTDWFWCVCFGKQAETASKYLAKGSDMLIKGEFHFDEYEKDGQKTKTHSINVREFEMLNKVEKVGDGSDIKPPTSDFVADENVPF